MKNGTILVVMLAAAAVFALVWNGSAESVRAPTGPAEPAQEAPQGVRPPAASELPAGHPPIGGEMGVAPGTLPAGHPPLGAAPARQEVDVAPLAGGTTVAQIVRNARKISGQRVRLAAEVVRSTPNVLGKTWLRVRDGSTGDDLVVTTDTTPSVGSVVEIEGLVATDKDLGSGYRYDVLIEDAVVRARDDKATP
jgi:hypothetical protein